MVMIGNAPTAAEQRTKPLLEPQPTLTKRGLNVKSDKMHDREDGDGNTRKPDPRRPRPRSDGWR